MTGPLRAVLDRGLRENGCLVDAAEVGAAAGVLV